MSEPEGHYDDDEDVGLDPDPLAFAVYKAELDEAAEAFG